jgi:hypothetical protein
MKNGIYGVGDKNKTHIPTLLLSESKVSDKTVLEYWQCGRKVKHHSQQEAEIHQIAVNDTGMGAYKCSHCDSFHNGHGDGKTKIEVQIEKAREHWNANPLKSNMFVEEKRLL